MPEDELERKLKNDEMERENDTGATHQPQVPDYDSHEWAEFRKDHEERQFDARDKKVLKRGGKGNLRASYEPKAEGSGN